MLIRQCLLTIVRTAASSLCSSGLKYGLRKDPKNSSNNNLTNNLAHDLVNNPAPVIASAPVFFCLFALCFLSSGISDAATTLQLSESNPTIFSLNQQLGRGINLSGLEPEQEGDWGFTLKHESLALIASKGFDSVRLPVNWASNASPVSNSADAFLKIRPGFFKRVDSLVKKAIENNLNIIINMHFFDELLQHPETNTLKFIDLWRQIAEHYQAYSDHLYFELLNEPVGAFSRTPALWNELLAKTLKVIRQSNPTRAVLVGPIGWNLIENLPLLQLPDDENLIVTVHYYAPGQFTHQGASWVEPMLPMGVEWQPQSVRLGPHLQDWSWSTESEPLENGVMGFHLKRQGAAVNLWYGAPVPLQSIDFEVRVVDEDESDSRGAKLNVLCGLDGKFKTLINSKLMKSGTWNSLQVDLSSCDQSAREVALQNHSSKAVRIELRKGEICGSTDCSVLVATELDVIGSAFEQARIWGQENNRPIHLGEYGAYEAADMPSRIRWTNAVTTSARKNHMSSAYWEFDRGFGIYDPESHSWREPLLESVLQNDVQDIEAD